MLGSGGRSSSCNVDEMQQKQKREYDDPEGSFKQYMRIKQQKLADQFLPQATQSQLFSKVTAYITGYTGEKIGDLELKRLIHAHGGKVVQFFASTSVTHVICLQLAGSKAEQLSKSKSLRIVRPDWVVDSVKEGRLLAESKYSVLSPIKPSTNSILRYLSNNKKS